LGCMLDAKFLMAICHKLEIGYMPWSWTGNNADNQWLDMVYYNKPQKLTKWGRLVLKSKYGIKRTSKTSSVFVK
jgi:mannan endo-1,4-beta-mannosidase